MTLDKINRLIAKREALHVKWRKQIASLSGDRNVTAGQIYEIDNEIRSKVSAYADRATREQYAASWVDRWPK